MSPAPTNGQTGSGASGFPLTKITTDILAKSSDLSIKFSKHEVVPLHMLLILLCGHNLDIDNFDRFSTPESPTVLWLALEELEIDQRAFANKIWQRVESSSGLRTPLSDSSAPILNDSLIVPQLQRAGSKRAFFRWNSSKQKAAPEEYSPFSSRSASPARGRPQTPNPGGKPHPPSEELTSVIIRAQNIMATAGDLYLTPYHLSLSFTDDQDTRSMLESELVGSADLVKSILEARKSRTKVTSSEDDRYPFLAKYATDLCEMVRRGRLSNIVGRDDEIRRVIQVLCRKMKNSAILLGEPGVGKTAVAEGLAHRIANNQVPDTMKGTIYSLDVGALFAGAGKGEYEERVKGVVDDVIRCQEMGTPVILFIDEIHLITVGKSPGGQNSGMDAANLLKPALARGQFRCIGATTLAEYREYIEKDGALERRFTAVMVEEPTISEAITILRGTRERYEEHHGVWIMDLAIIAAVTLAHRYLTSRRLPDSAVDLMDEACASAKVAQQMSPEVIDSLIKEKHHAHAHIQALERDGHPEDVAALAETKKRLADIEKDLKILEKQQESAKKWWRNISAKRGMIDDQKEALQTSKNANNSKKVAEDEQRLKNLRAELLSLETKGPEPVNVDAQSTDIYVSTFLTSPHTITPESIAAMVEKATKIPVQRLLATDKARLRGLTEALTKQVVGQEEAVKAVSDAIQVSRTGLGSADHPVSLLFTGPSGTGKTLLCKALAHELFGQSTTMIRIDGSEYSESHSISRLIGSPPGYVGYDQGGQLTEYVRRTPYCIILLDEIEKTCQEFWTVFLQVLDEGRLTDGRGRLVDFRNCVIIMTSNVGADILSQAEGSIAPSVRNQVMKRFKMEGFPVEFLNRIDEIVMFRAMSSEAIGEILNQHLRDLQQREGIRKFKLDVQNDARKWLIKEGISPEYGARPLARVIQRHLLNPFSKCILDEQIHENDTVIISLNETEDGLLITRDPLELPSHSGRR